MVEEDPDQVEQFLAIPWNLVYDQRPARYKDAFQTGQGVERWRPFWAIRYNLTSGRRVDPWRRLSDWTDPRVVAVIDPKAREGLRAEERRDLDVFLKEFGFEPISAPSPPGKTDAKQVRTQVGSLDELEAALEAGYPRLLYWLGHAQPGLPLARRRAYLPGRPAAPAPHLRRPRPPRGHARVPQRLPHRRARIEGFVPPRPAPLRLHRRDRD